MATNEAFQQAGWSAEDCDRLDEMVCAVVQSTAKLRKHLAVGPKPANPYQIPVPTISAPPARGRLVGPEGDLRGKGSADPVGDTPSFVATVTEGSLSHQLTGAATLTTGAFPPVRLSTRFRLSQDQVADQEVVSMLARRQASQLASVEDLVLAAGTAGFAAGTRFPFGGSRVAFLSSKGSVGGLILAIPDKPSDILCSIKKARAALESEGHPGPFALVLGSALYQELACTCGGHGKEYYLETVRRWFAPDGFVVGLGADGSERSPKFDGAGFVFSLEPGAFDVVSVAKPHIAFISRDEEGQVLAVEETFLLRRLDPSAVRHLEATAK
ncbi:MAG: encapsulin [Polyangiaceae bacterium]